MWCFSFYVPLADGTEASIVNLDRDPNGWLEPFVKLPVWESSLTIFAFVPSLEGLVQEKAAKLVVGHRQTGRLKVKNGRKKPWLLGGCTLVGMMSVVGS